jgi:hypothetical protein
MKKQIMNCTTGAVNIVDMTPEEAAAQDAAFQNEAVKALQNEALAALVKSDGVALRCVKAGVAFPAEWKTYVTDLRAIVDTGAGSIPAPPEYPAGT